MKLSKLALDRINTPKGITELMLGLGFSELWIKRLIKNNKVNGPLTTVKALEVIQEHTGLAIHQIIEQPKVRKVAKASAL